jgi:predicted nucleotidyltransferase
VLVVTAPCPTDHYPQGTTPSEAELLATLADVVSSLDAAGIDHALMGGISAYTMARPRVTEDIDLFVRPGDVQSVFDALDAGGFETREHDRSWLAKAWKRGVLVDIIFRSSGDIYLDDEMMGRRHVGDYKGVRVGMVAPEDLLVIKALAAAEPTPHHWYDALALIARCDLDWDYVLHRARQAGPRRVLSLLLYAESSDLVVPSTTISTLYETVHPHAGATP